MTSAEPTKRPILLTWLCLGSGLFGIAWISMFLGWITYSTRGAIPGGLFPGITLVYLKSGPGFILAELLLSISGMAGVVLMWKARKSGFYVYSVSKAILYFLPVAIIGSSQLAFFPLAVTSVLIVAYGILTGIFREND